MPQHLPTSLLPRTAAAARVAFGLGRSVFGRRSGAAGGEVDDERVGEAVAAELDQLKGLGMKIGQILSSLEVGLPPALQRRLARVQTGREGLPWAAMSGEIERGLGGPLSAFFDAIDPVPVAAASIGQVFRARVGDRALAVKVRYPGVRESLGTDLAALRRLSRFAALATAVDGPALVEELARHFLEECDYGHERRALERAGVVLAGLPGVVVPVPVAALCAENVLTTSWCDGEPLGACLRLGPVRRLLALPWWSLGRAGFLHADPHPGNFLAAGEVLVVLDWGCTRELGALELEALRGLLRALRGRGGGVREAVAAAGFVGDVRFDHAEAGAYFRWLFEPYLAPSFAFTPTWLARGERFSAPSARNARHLALPPAWVWLLRVFLASYTLATRAGVEGDFRAHLDPLLTDGG